MATPTTLTTSAACSGMDLTTAPGATTSAPALPLRNSTQVIADRDGLELLALMAAVTQIMGGSSVKVR
jgi:hypothetical protein